MNPLLIIEVILAFGFMVTIHEYGHYLVCRLFGVEVEEFAIGFGNLLYSRKMGSTLFSLRAFPLGGYCKPKGGDLSGQSAEEMYANAPKPGEFLFASWWKRVAIFLAGPGMNYVSAFFIIFIVLFVIGERVSNTKPILGFVPPNSLAAQAGLQKGDEILKIDGQPVSNFLLDLDKMEKHMLQGAGSPGVFTLSRNGKTLEVKFPWDPKKLNSDPGIKTIMSKPDVDPGIQIVLPPVIGTVHIMTPARKAGLEAGDKILSVNGQKVSEWGEASYLIRNSASDEIKMDIERSGKVTPVKIQRVYNGVSKMIGIGPQTTHEGETVQRRGFSESLTLAFTATLKISQGMLDGLGQLVTGKVSFRESIGGPISIMRMMYQTASRGLEDFLSLVATISLMLCIMNLLPLGIVDGGQIVLCLIEGIKRNPVPVKIQLVYQQVGFVLVIGLMAFAVFNDTWGWFLEKFRSQIH